MAKKIYTDYDFRGNTVTGIANASGASDAVNKSQLDAQNTELRAYIDGQILGLGEFVGEIDPSNGLPTTGSGAAGTIDAQDWWYINTGGTLLGVSVHKGDRLQAMIPNPDTTDNTAANTDFKLLHTYHGADSRFPLSNLALTANTPLNINHGLGYRFVQVAIADSTGNKVDVEVNYVDENNLTLTATENLTVYGVISI